MSKLLLYPSGKAAIRSEITRALSIAADHDRLPYREPFLGGGVMTLHTLDFDRADSIWLNDVDVGLVCFWKTVIECPDLLLARVESFVPSVEAWQVAKRACQKHDRIPCAPDRIADLGFQKLVVQRLSHSGRGVQSGSVRGGNRQGRPNLQGRKAATPGTGLTADGLKDRSDVMYFAITTGSCGLTSYAARIWILNP